MKMRRFFAQDMNAAMTQVREAIGEDAIILSNRKLDEGVEMMVAIDYDEDAFKAKVAKKPVLANKAKINNKKMPTEALATSKATPIMAKRNIKRSSYADKALAMLDQNSVDWTQDPVLSNMQSELRALRGLLEDQLAGLVWGNTERQNPTQASVFRQLTNLGLDTELCRQFSQEVATMPNADQAWQTTLESLSHSVKITEDDILRNGGVVALLGSPGVGKTTTIAKLAARFALHYGPDHVALLTTDTHRIAAIEQLKIYGKILGITVKSINDGKSLRSALRVLRDKRLILLDTAGMSQDDFRIKEQLSVLKGRQLAIKNYLVLPATSQYLVLKEAVRTFAEVELAGAIITKLDECRSLGPLLSILIQSQLPVAYVTDGQRVPEDLHSAKAQVLLGNAVTIAQKNQEDKHDQNIAVAYGRGVVDADI